MSSTLTLDQLQLWLTELGMQKVIPQMRKALLPEVAARLRAQGLDPDTTCWITSPPKEGAYFHVSEFSGDDTGGQPRTQLTIHPFRDAVLCSPGSDYSDGCIVFDATAAGVVEAVGFFEQYAGHEIWGDQGNQQLIPVCLKDLKDLFELFRHTFSSFCLELDEASEQEGSDA